MLKLSSNMDTYQELIWLRYKQSDNIKKAETLVASIHYLQPMNDNYALAKKR